MWRADQNGFYPVSLYKSNENDIEILPFNSEGRESCWRWGKERAENNINLILPKVI